MAFKQVVVNGKVSNQAPNLVNPSIEVNFQTNGSGVFLSTPLNPDGSFSTSFTPSKAGDWTVQAKVAEDALYLAAQSPVIPFTAVDVPASKLPRTITLVIA